MSSLLDLIIPSRRNKRDLIFNTAIESSNKIQSLFKLYKEGDFNIELHGKSFTRIFEHDANSPAIYWIDDKQLIIRYPSFSTPYTHSFIDKCKYVECLSGILYDKNSDLKLFPGDRIKVDPKDNYAPYADEKPVYLRVCIAECNSIWERVCE